jgi:hypothetical protein
MGIVPSELVFEVGLLSLDFGVVCMSSSGISWWGAALFFERDLEVRAGLLSDDGAELVLGNGALSFLE